MGAPLDESFRRYAGRKLVEHFAQIERCARLLSSEQLWFHPNASSHSVGNLLLHLAGNVRQWILGGLAGRPIERNRQGEFDHREPWPAEQALEPLREAVRAAIGVIDGLGDEALRRSYSIQDYSVTGVEAVMHVVEHFAFHTGQIVTTTKWLLDVDLSLYDERGHRRDGRQSEAP